jgi:hypothetical protein
MYRIPEADDRGNRREGASIRMIGHRVLVFLALSSVEDPRRGAASGLREFEPSGNVLTAPGRGAEAFRSQRLPERQVISGQVPMSIRGIDDRA